jgi:hypothetical protein
MPITLEDIIQTSLTRGDKGEKGEIGNLRNIAGVSDVLEVKTNASGTVTHNTSNTNIFVHTTPTANFAANFINVPETNSRVTTFHLIMIQGSTARMPTALQIGDVSQTIKWGGGVAPSGTSNGVDIVTFILIRINDNWTILGQSSIYL